MDDSQKPVATNSASSTPVVPTESTSPFAPAASMTPPVPAAPQISHITFDDFLKVQIRAGKILSAEKIPDTDKLLRLSVDFAEATPRQIVSGIAISFPDPSVIVGKTCMFVTNLAPRTIRGHESNGMILTVANDTGTLSLLEVGETAGAVGGVVGRAIPLGTMAK